MAYILNYIIKGIRVDITVFYNCLYSYAIQIDIKNTPKHIPLYIQYKFIYSLREIIVDFQSKLLITQEAFKLFYCNINTWLMKYSHRYINKALCKYL